jgi:hypothetical protein
VAIQCGLCRYILTGIQETRNSIQQQIAQSAPEMNSRSHLPPLKPHAEPSKTEAILLLVLTFGVQVFEVFRTIGWRARAIGVFDNLDNSNYISIVDFIRQWTPSTSFDFNHFWGYPYFIVAVSTIFHLQTVDALIVISVSSSLVTCFLIQKLYGGLVAVAFGMVSSTWILLSVFGGCEPLFMALLFGSFLAVRHKRFAIAAFLGCLATTVRPIGVFMPVALFGYLLWLRDWRTTLKVSGVGLAMTVAYLIPVYVLTGNALIQPGLYSVAWQAHDFPFGHRGLFTFPLLRLAQGFYYLHAVVSDYPYWGTWISSGLRFIWIVIAIGGAILMWTPRRWHDLPPVETMFACSYSAFLLCYNFDGAVLYIQRFILPVLPFILFAVRKWIPRDRRTLWPLAGFFILFNTVVLFGLKAVFGLTAPKIPPRYAP